MSDPTLPTTPDALGTPDAAAALPAPDEVEALPAPDEPVAVAAALAPAPVTTSAAPRARQSGPYAVIKTGGKQYRVMVGDRIAVERLPDEAGHEITLDQVLLIGGDGATRVGTPLVGGATVTAQVDAHYRGEKIIVFKYKPKKRYRRKMGHRQELTRLVVTGIIG